MTSVNSFPIEHPLLRQNARVSCLWQVEGIALIKAHLILKYDVFFSRIM